MISRRDILLATTGLVGTAIPRLVGAQAGPCMPPSLTLDGTSAPSGTCPTAGLPEYISGMSSYQVRALTGTYSPTNGKETLRSVTPAEWLAAENDNVMAPWSGGPKPTNGTRMYVHGGGHSDSLNNGVYRYDFAGTTKPTGWTLQKISAVSAANPSGNGSYSDGNPESAHTYDGMCELNGVLYRFGGAGVPNGYFLNDAWAFNTATSAWSRLADIPVQWGGFAIAHPGTNKILLLERWVTYNTYTFYRVGTNNYSSVKNASQQWPDLSTLAMKPLTSTTSLGLVSGRNKSFSLSIDWSAETVSQTSRTISSFQSLDGPSIVYDPTRDRFWIFGGSPQSSSIGEINPSTWAVTSHSLTGSSMGSGGSGYEGSYGRFVFMDSFRAIGFVNNVEGPSYVIKLP